MVKAMSSFSLRRRIWSAASSTPTALDGVETFSSPLKGRQTAHRPQRFWFVIASSFLVSLMLSQCRIISDMISVTSDNDQILSFDFDPSRGDGRNSSFQRNVTLSVSPNTEEPPSQHEISTNKQHKMRATPDKARIVFLTGDSWRRDDRKTLSFQRDKILSIAVPSGEKPEEKIPPFKQFIRNPMQPWQTKSFPTCNLIHEINIQDQDKGNQNKQKQSKVASYVNDAVSILGSGWFRHTWKFTAGLSSETAVIKTLRYVCI